MRSTLKRTWAQIDLDALEHNYKTIRQKTGQGVGFLGVVKADAYGHGAIQVSGLLQELGADYLGVSSIDEAAELRYGGITMPILILGYTPADQVGQLIDLRITQTVTDFDAASEYSRAAAAHGGTLRVHIKADTGMSRLGFRCADDAFDESVEQICRACSLPGLDCEGIFTHFAVSDESDEESQEYTQRQFELFTSCIAAVEEKRGRKFALRHCANTGATACLPETYLDMVRPGLLLYGCGAFAKEMGLRPVMTLKTYISTIKSYPAGTSVSYGRRFVTERATRMGVVPYGYADGFLRCLSDNCALMTADGPAPVRGRICMDMCMIDLTDLPGVKAGDEVEIFGSSNSADDLASAAGTISYELLTSVSKRVPRIYYRAGKEIARELLLRF